MSGAARVPFPRAARMAVLVAVLVAPTPAAALVILPAFGNLPADYEAVVHASIASWESSILDPFVVAIDFGLTALSGETLAHTLDFVAAPDGRPNAARIEIDDRDGDLGWFIDPTPRDASEFIAKRRRLVADPAGPAARRFDLLTVINHEIAHALGFSVFYPFFDAHVVIDPDGTRHYRNIGLDVLMPSAGTHVADGAFPYDLMTSLLGAAERRPVSAIDLLMLSDAFRYRVVLPTPPTPSVPEPTPVGFIVVALLLRAVRRGSERHRD